MATTKITKHCEKCGAQFLFQPRRKSRGRFCSWECRDYRSPEQIAERFWAYVDKSGECWLWTGYCRRYGQFNLQGRGNVIGAHRFAYILTYGQIPDEIQVLHRCDNPPCVRPDHLFLGTQLDNIADMIAKGRHRPTTKTGFDHGQTRITAEQIRAIRAAPGSHASIGKAFGFSQPHVSAIKAGRKWSHVT